VDALFLVIFLLREVDSIVFETDIHRDFGRVLDLRSLHLLLEVFPRILKLNFWRLFRLMELISNTWRRSRWLSWRVLVAHRDYEVAVLVGRQVVLII